jgi:hypothetical protein
MSNKMEIADRNFYIGITLGITVGAILAVSIQLWLPIVRNTGLLSTYIYAACDGIKKEAIKLL